MQVTTIYIISQVITVIYFAILSSSYLLKERKKILFANFVAHIGQTSAMYLLNGLTGSAMAGIMMLRDVVLLIQERNGEKKTNPKLDLIILLVTIFLIIILTIYTYNGLLSLLSVVATLITTYALWQKNTKVYKVLGFVAGLLWLFYNIYILSVMGIILESILLICTVIGFCKEKKVKHERRRVQ